MEIAVGDEVDVKFTVKDLTLELNIVCWGCLTVLLIVSDFTDLQSTQHSVS